jgi:hypothetical protein
MRYMAGRVDNSSEAGVVGVGAAAVGAEMGVSVAGCSIQDRGGNHSQYCNAAAGGAAAGSDNTVSRFDTGGRPRACPAQYHLRMSGTIPLLRTGDIRPIHARPERFRSSWCQESRESCWWGAETSLGTHWGSPELRFRSMRVGSGNQLSHHATMS